MIWCLYSDILQSSNPREVDQNWVHMAQIFHLIGGLPNLSTPCFTKYLHWSLSMTLCRRTHSSPLFWANSSIQIRRTSRSSRVPGSSSQLRRLYIWSIDSIGAITLTYDFKISIRMAQSLLISEDDSVLGTIDHFFSRGNCRLPGEIVRPL